MNTSNNNYYLKNGAIYKLIGSTKRAVNVDDVLQDINKGTLFIDDSYFFYVGMENVAVSGKKLHAIAENYLNIMFPQDMVKSFGTFQHSNITVIFLLNQEIIDIINDYKQLFSSFRKITTPFLEMCTMYPEFIYSDGTRLYKKSLEGISLFDDKETDAVTSQDLFETAQNIKTNINLPGVEKKSIANFNLLAPAILLGVCYIVFIIGGIFDIKANNKVAEYYNTQLNNVYKNMGIDTSKDPYGVLVQKSKLVTNEGKSQKVLHILNDINQIKVEGISFKTITIKDNDIRLEGNAENFSQVEKLKQNMEALLKEPVNADDTKKTKDGISFVIKYAKLK